MIVHDVPHLQEMQVKLYQFKYFLSHTVNSLNRSIGSVCLSGTDAMLHILYTQVSVVPLRNEYIDLNLSHMTIFLTIEFLHHSESQIKCNLKGMIFLS